MNYKDNNDSKDNVYVVLVVSVVFQTVLTD